MLNIIKMDVYKTFRSRSFYILHLILLVIVLAAGIAIKYDVSRDYETAKASNIALRDEDTSTSDESFFTEEEYIQMQQESIQEMDVKEFMTIQYSGITLMLMATFLAIFVCSELDTGFIKNITPLKHSRSSLVLSKSIVAILFIVIQAAIVFGGSLFSTILLSGKIDVVHPKELAIYVGLQMILATAFASSIILIGYLTKSKAATMSAGILFSLNVQGLFLSLFDQLINRSSIRFSQLSIINNARMSVFESTDYQRVLLISIVFFFFYNIISTIRVRKMEID